nr:nitrite reductase small subunit NirD [Nocardiopsis ganjiahuensis]
MSVLTHVPAGPPPAAHWVTACPQDRLETEIGLAVLLPDGHQVALFRTRDHHLYAVDNLDPHTGATVISRGIVGDRAGEPTVASPMLKHVFSLRTGQSLDTPGIGLSTWPVRVQGQNVQIATTPHTGPGADTTAPQDPTSPNPPPRATAPDTTRAEEGTP